MTITGNGDLTTNSSTVAAEICSKLTASDAHFTTIIFKSGSEHCSVDNTIIQAFLYTSDYAANTTLKKLDLSDVTATGTPCFINSEKSWLWTSTRLNEIVLPTVAKAVDGTMTVPASFFHYDNSGTTSAAQTTYNETVDGTYQTFGRPAKIVVPEGYTIVGEGAFADLNGVETIVLPDDVTSICASAFSGCSALASVSMPSKLVTLGNKAFYNCAKLTEVSFPKTLTSIGRSAYAICNGLNKITLNEGLKTIGNSAFYLASENYNQKVLSVPSTVTYIGAGAFNMRLYADVYYYGEKAPLSPYAPIDENAAYSASAFGSLMLCGNNGFSPSRTDGTTAGDISKGYANRENYYNSKYIAVLHFRDDISDENAETFTDITRKYETWMDGNGNWSSQKQKEVGQETEAPSFSNFGPGVAKVVTPGFKDTALGEQYIWPSQSQFIRSWAVNSNGLKWDGVTQYLPSLTDDEIKMIKSQETSLAEKTDDEIKKLAYMGTRQFVLISRDVTGKKDEYPVPVTEGGRWWTLCVPCDVTKKEVDRVFGEGTHLCLFSKVIRQVDSEKGNEIHLFFQNDTYTNKYTRQGDGTWTKGDAVSSDDDVVLYAHTPYMIYPTKTMEDKTQYVLENYELQSGDALPTVVASLASASAESAASDAVKYNFVSTYRKRLNAPVRPSASSVSAKANAETTSNVKTVKLPQYSYVFGRQKNSQSDGTDSRFWFYIGTTATWSANKCIVERTDDENNEKEFTDFFQNVKKQTQQYSVFGDGDDATAIDRVIVHYGDDASKAIYNLNGQLVSRDGSTQGLPKGIYVQAGRKFIVR